MDLHLHKAFRRYDFWRPSRFWLENCALGLRHVWEESASASDLKAIVTGIWDILRSCHVAYCIKSDAWTHHISVSKIGWILVRTSFDRCVQTKARPTSFAKWESWQVVSAFCMSGDFAFCYPLLQRLAVCISSIPSNSSEGGLSGLARDRLHSVLRFAYHQPLARDCRAYFKHDLSHVHTCAPYATISLCQANQWLSWGDLCCHISVSSCRLFSAERMLWPPLFSFPDKVVATALVNV